MKKITFMLLALIAAVTVNAAVTVDDFTYGFYTSGNAYVISYNGTETSLTIPETITYDDGGTEKTVPVAGFGPNAFLNNTTIEKVYLPRNASYTVGASAFKGCTALNTIAYSYTGASQYINRDNYITIPTSTLNANVFEGCISIENVYCRYNQTGGIGASAFKGCTALKYASVSAACASIGESAFEGCTSLVTFDGCRYKVTSNNVDYFYSCTIGNMAFKDCTSLKFFGSSTTYAYLGGNKNTASFTSVVSVGESAFENCQSLYVAYFHRVASIGANAFKGCTGLGYIYFVKADGTYNVLKSGDTDIAEVTLGEGCFEGCTALVRQYNVEYSPGEGSSLNSAYQPNTIFTAIPARAFYGCSKLSLMGGTGTSSTATTTLYGGVSMPNVTSIGESAFEGCSALAYYYNLGVSNPTIGASAFKDCTSLTRFGTRSNAIELFGASVGANAFQNCALPTTLFLGEDLANIGASAFEGCSALATIWMDRMEDAPIVGEDAFKDIASTAKFLLAPQNSYTKIANYALDNVWKTFFDGTKASYPLYAFVNKSKQYGTVSCAVPLYFAYTSTANIYIVKSSSKSFAGLKEASRKVPANTGAIVEMAADGEAFKNSTQVQVLFDGSENTAAFDGNKLVANVDENPDFLGQSDGKYNMILVNGEFVKANDGTLAAGLAYLPVALDSESKLTLDFNGETTGVETVDGVQNVENGAWYTPQGVRVAQPTKGVYIHNGKKVLVK